jgi:hypothetical protein
MVARLLSYILSVSLLTGCAGASPQLRLSRTLVGLGAAAVVVGALVASGCSEPPAGNYGDYGCSGGPSTANPEDGLPVMAAGAALIGAGLLAKPPEQGALFPRQALLPIPMLPDPFVPGPRQYPP